MSLLCLYVRGAGIELVDAWTPEDSLNVYIVAITDQFIVYPILDLQP
jgi:hypothetical protein